MSDASSLDPSENALSSRALLAVFLCYAATVVVFPNVVAVLGDLSIAVPQPIAQIAFWAWTLTPPLVVTSLVVRFGVHLSVSGTTTALGKLARREHSLALDGPLALYGLLLVVFPLVYYVAVVVVVLAVRLPGIYQLASQLPMRIVEPGTLALANFLPIVQLVVNAVLPPLALFLLKALSLTGVRLDPSGS